MVKPSQFQEKTLTRGPVTEGVTAGVALLKELENTAGWIREPCAIKTASAQSTCLSPESEQHRKPTAEGNQITPE